MGDSMTDDTVQKHLGCQVVGHGSSKSSMATFLTSASALSNLGCLRDQLCLVSPGFCWRSLFASNFHEYEWLSISCIRTLSTRFVLNRKRRFQVSFCAPGLLHVEVDDRGIWFSDDILRLPGWMLIGGTLEHDAIEDGYPPRFIRQFLAEWRNGRPLANAHDAFAIELTPSQGSDSSGQLSTTSSTRAAGNKGVLLEILSLHQSLPPEILRQKFKQKLETSDCGLGRVDMELIPMALGGFCYSACVASQEDFKDDLCRSYWRGSVSITTKELIKVVDQVDSLDEMIREGRDPHPTANLLLQYARRAPKSADAAQADLKAAAAFDAGEVTSDTNDVPSLGETAAADANGVEGQTIVTNIQRAVVMRVAAADTNLTAEVTASDANNTVGDLNRTQNALSYLFF
ncbi:hypothetical protein D9619_013210 [Psilocybe cf. subviscida]|uniref:Uncharacterized protein n=1 Tax=Psilocybe cf. subviscida TaxID=2480587 RepID=A0A8H5B691_9AGAR|nr:hypothetical protein D9619_013210 [Psilocybe cf. subviscida]